MTTIGLDLISKTDWIEMFPFGVALGASQTRPVMIFKDKTGKKVLPVWLSAIDAGIAVSQSSGERVVSPHEISCSIFNALGVSLEKCLFKLVKNNHQYVEIHISGSRKLKNIEARASDAISFCLRSGCRFFATVDYIEKSRVLEDEQGVSRKPMNHPLPHSPSRYLN